MVSQPIAGYPYIETYEPRAILEDARIKGFNVFV